MWELDLPSGSQPIGYRYLIENLKVEAIPHYRWSFVGPGWEDKVFKYAEPYLEVRLFPKSYAIGNDFLKNLEFALKYEGINLSIAKSVFAAIGAEKTLEYVQASPTGKYARKIWFLYEFLLNEKLPLQDLHRGSYVSLADAKDYYCGRNKKSSRHRVVDNLLGTRFFSPTVRRSARLAKFEEQNLSEVAKNITKRYNAALLSRAIRYLYTKETIASWEIEREKPDTAKVARFVALLQRDHAHDPLTKEMLVSLQKEIVDKRFALSDYRSFQNYVGEEPQPGEMIVHYIAPRPEDLPGLMQAFLECAERMLASQIDPVVVAAVIAFSFVFMHPFEDGNGRLHRFLIHYVLSKLGFTPQGVIFPVSAAILQEVKDYDRALESFSRPLSDLLQKYEINDIGQMTVNCKTADFYRYIDLTPIAEFLYRCVEITIHTGLERELDFLSRYDVIKRQLKEVVDMPDRQIDLLIKCVRQNNGRLSERKRSSLFTMLTAEEIQEMESVIAKNER